MKSPRLGCARAGARHRKALRVESLEQRCLLSGFHDVDDVPLESLTISFAPDGTDIFGETSALYATLDAVHVDWQSEIVNAFESWTTHLGIDVQVIADDGRPFGIERDFGHVRVGARGLSTDILASAISMTNDDAGAWAGTIIFNANHTFDTPQQFFATAIHEVGHVLGLEHSDDPDSVMYAKAFPVAVEPTAADVAMLELIHEDHFDSHGDSVPGWSHSDLDLVFSELPDRNESGVAASFELASTQFVHIELGDDVETPGFTTIVVRDAGGLPVHETQASEVIALLEPGAYTVEVIVSPQGSLVDGSIPNPQIEVLDRHLGPEIDDPSGTPITPCSDGIGEFCYPDEIHSWDTFVWIDDEWVMDDDGDTGPPLGDPGWWIWYVALISG